MRTARPGPGEGLAIDDLFRQSKLPPGLTHFVFEQLSHRFDELEMHFLRQPADVVMTLDHVRWISADGHAFDHIGIERALGEKSILWHRHLACGLCIHRLEACATVFR